MKRLKLTVFKASDKDASGLHYCAKAIVEAIRTGQPVDQENLLSRLDALKLKSKQKSLRILQYWKKFLIDNGFITCEKKQAAEPVSAPAAATLVPAEGTAP